MLWLCQITFAGVGALTTAQLANNHGWPVLAAVVAGGRGRPGDGRHRRLPEHPARRPVRRSGHADVRAAHREPRLHPADLREPGPRADPHPTRASPRPTRSFAYLCLVAFILVALFIVNFRRSTTGLALNAARWSEAGARTSGISVVQMKVIAGGTGGLHRRHRRGPAGRGPDVVPPSEFATFAGIVWLAVLVTIGVRSTAAALVAGLAFVMLPALVAGVPPDLDGERAAGALRPGRHLGGQVPRRRPGRAEPPAAAAVAERDAGPSLGDGTSR